MDILLVADDLTGTLDGAVPFIAAGVDVCVSCAEDAPVDASAFTAPVVAVNADTRHLGAAEARARVAAIVEQGLRAGARIVVKKTDSALRGNIGAELAAVLDGAARVGSASNRLHFIPAFPALGRITCGGVQYIDGVPVNESVFGRDPFEPVVHAAVRDIVRAQAADVSAVSAELAAPGAQDAAATWPQIVICDAETDEDVARWCSGALAGDAPVLLAGCAGLTRALARVLGIGNPPITPSADGWDPCLLVFCGSVNEVSKNQCAFAAEAGYPLFSLPAAGIVQPTWSTTDEFFALRAQVCEAWSAHDLTVVDCGARITPKQAPEGESAVMVPSTPEELRRVVAANLGAALAALVDGRDRGTVFAMGGDVLQAFLKRLEVASLAMVAEVAPGVVMSECACGGTHLRVISKSGGFGSADLFVNLAQKLSKKVEV